MKLINNRSTLPMSIRSNPLAIAVVDKYGPAENFIASLIPTKPGIARGICLKP